MTEYISREEMYQANKNVWKGVGGLHGCTIFRANIDMIDSVPAADVVEVRHGRWILFDKTFGTVVCDQCHRQDHFDLLAKYCRYCGAKMDGGVNDATD